MTDKNRKNLLERMGRRRFIRNAAAFGFSAASFSAMTQAEMAEAMTGDRVEYVAAIRPDGDEPEPMYRTMERDEWVRRRAAVRLMERIQTQLDNRFDDRQLTASFVADDDSHTGFGVEVEYTTTEAEDSTRTPAPSIEEVRRFLPDTGKATVGGEQTDEETVREMPIRVVESKHVPASWCQETSSVQDFTTLPGGVPMAADDGSSDGVQGSIGETYEHGTYGCGWITAGHVVGDVGIDCYYPEVDDAYIGVSKLYENYNDYKDWAFIQADNGCDAVGGRIADPDASGDYDFDVIGHLTDTELENDVGTSTTYYNQGRASCRTNGTLGGTTTYGWQCDANADPGDSGGAFFKKAGGGDVYVGGHITIQRGWIGDNSGGCKASVPASVGQYLTA